MKNKNLKLYTVRKFVWASSVVDAVKKEKKVVATDVWLDDDFRKAILDYKMKQNK